MFGVAQFPSVSGAVAGIAQVWVSEGTAWLLLVGVVVWWLYSRSSDRSRAVRSRDPTRVAPAYGLAAGSLDLRDDRDGPPHRDEGRFEHEVVGHRGEDSVVEVSDGDRSARFLVRSTSGGDRLVSPADSVDRHHEEAWLRDAREYLRTATLTRWAELETE